MLRLKPVSSIRKYISCRSNNVFVENTGQAYLSACTRDARNHRSKTKISDNQRLVEGFSSSVVKTTRDYSHWPRCCVEYGRVVGDNEDPQSIEGKFHKLHEKQNRCARRKTAAICSSIFARKYLQVSRRGRSHLFAGQTRLNGGQSTYKQPIVIRRSWY